MFCTTYKKHEYLGTKEIFGKMFLCFRPKDYNDLEVMAVSKVDYYNGYRRFKIDLTKVSSQSFL